MNMARGDTPLLQILGTGGGKSLTFLLPAFYCPQGITIVIVPLVALREDLHRHYNKLGIQSYIWTRRMGAIPTTILFITPESATTKQFREYAMRLNMRQLLDRIVIDECHVILDANQDL
ncbi:hypothetical protein S40293_10263 [Stachybotrys chartarum IBT 40293]|nr:hypothetical protein S40293_10263 [Stachybotrys chartarum IBT 40293]